jgi:hypothetical protein
VFTFTVSESPRTFNLYIVVAICLCGLAELQVKQKQLHLKNVCVSLVCSRFSRFHSTHRIVAPFVRQLQQHFRVTLYVTLLPPFKEAMIDQAGFDSVRFVTDDGTTAFLQSELTWIRNQRFQVAFFPEVCHKRDHAQFIIMSLLLSELNTVLQLQQ